MNRNAQVEALRPHLRRPIRAFLADPSISDTPAHEAFWTAIWGNHVTVDHTDACTVATKLETSTERVERVLEGWRP
jgi:hypothetical protein